MVLIFSQLPRKVSTNSGSLLFSRGFNVGTNSYFCLLFFKIGYSTLRFYNFSLWGGTRTGKLLRTLILLSKKWIVWRNQGSTRRKGRRQPLLDRTIICLSLSIEKKQIKPNNPQSDEVLHFSSYFVCSYMSVFKSWC